MSKKQLSGPAVTVIVVIIAILVLGAGYYYLNKDSMGKEGEARKLNPPGVLSKDYNPKNGPFPDPSGIGAVRTPNGAVSGAGKLPEGAKAPGN